MTEPKKRSAVLAGLLNTVCPGLGFLYLGRLRWAIAFLISDPLLLGLGAWTKVVFLPSGYVVVMLLLVTAWVVSVVIAVQMARRDPPAPLSGIQRWYVYVGFFLFSILVFGQVLDRRGQLFGYETFRFPSRSMAETLQPGDYFISNTWKFRNRSPERGELVVFLYPKDPTVKYIKRIIGLPRDTVQISGPEVRVNGIRLDEPYVTASNNRGLPIGNGEFRVPEGSYFVLGDNRDNSSDSRFWGPVPSENLYGNVEFIFWSFDSAHGLRTERLGLRVK